MSHDQLVNASTECSKEFVIANTHRAKYGVITARRTDLMGNSDIHREISHPIGFWHWKQIWMVTQTPGDNAGSRTWRAHYKNRFIYFIVHFTVILLHDILRATFSGFLVRPRLSHCHRGPHVFRRLVTVFWLIQDDHKIASPAPVSADSPFSI